MSVNDIICAPATPFVNSALAVIRVSGDGALILFKNSFSSYVKVSHAKAVYGKLSSNGRILDELILSYFESPASFTGEDTVELSCHGNPLIVKNIISFLLESGARMAEPGEFSRRAFINGKMDLTEAESVNALICARSDWEINTALSQMHGSLKNVINSMREKLILLKGDIESAIDFSTEEIEFVSRAEALKQAEEIRDEVKDVLRRCSSGAKLSGGIDVPIVGKPNSGKSSLLNLILNSERAIVSNIPGTTRDMIKETVQFGGVHVNIYDTAGIRDADCEIEKIGIEKSREILSRSEISVVMLDALSGIDSFDEEILKITENKKSVILLNKTDCADSKEVLSIKKKIGRDIIDFSALTGHNFSEFHSKLSEAVRSNFSGCSNSFIADMRVLKILEHSSDAADNLVNSIDCGNPEEIIAADAAELINSLSEITGLISPDDILNSIFGRFCIGK